MSNQSNNPVAKFLREKGFQTKLINDECTQVSLSTRKLYASEVERAIGDELLDYYIEQSDQVVYVVYYKEL